GSLWWQFPLLQVLWVNLHGGAAIIGPLAVAARAASELSMAEPSQRGKSLRWTALSALGLTVMIVNPHGARIFSHLYSTLTFPNRTLFLDWPVIPEWAPIW